MGAIERLCRVALVWLTRVARRGWLAAVLVAAIPVLYHCWLALFAPLPYPYSHDEFSYLLGAETFALGRLANPTPPFPEHFEAIHELIRPAYASKYPVGQSAALAVGTLLFGDPYWGVLLTLALVGAATVWCARAWMSPVWSMLAGVQAMATFGLEHYWAESYWGGGLAFLGAMLALGGYRRLTARQQTWAAWPLAAGVAILGVTRPYEGGVLALTVAGALLWHVAREPGLRRTLLRGLPAILLPFGTLAFQLAVNHAVTGSYTRLPYVEYSSQYTNTPSLWILPPAEGQRGGSETHRMVREWEFEQYRELAETTVLNALRTRAYALADLMRDVFLWIPLAGVLAIVSYRKMPVFLMVAMLTTGASLMLGTWLHQHYAAPFLAVCWMFQFAAFSRLWPGRRFGRRLGAVATVFLVFIGCGNAVLLAAGTAYRVSREGPSSFLPRQSIEMRLEAIPGEHLVLTSEGGWIYNSADIESARIVWARDLGESANAALLEHFRDRTVWLADPSQRDPETGEVLLRRLDGN